MDFNKELTLSVGLAKGTILDLARKVRQEIAVRIARLRFNSPQNDRLLLILG